MDTTATSRKSTELTKSCVTKAICDRFKTELNGLGLAHLRVAIPRGLDRAQKVAEVVEESVRPFLENQRVEDRNRQVCLPAPRIAQEEQARVYRREFIDSLKIRYKVEINAEGRKKFDEHGSPD